MWQMEMGEMIFGTSKGGKIQIVVLLRDPLGSYCAYITLIQTCHVNVEVYNLLRHIARICRVQFKLVTSRICPSLELGKSDRSRNILSWKFTSAGGQP